MTIKLKQYVDGSFLSMYDGDVHLGSITYTQKTHKYRSESDYKLLTTENNTYSDDAVTELFNYLQSSRSQR